MKQLIAGVVLDVAGAGLIAFFLLQKREDLLWVGVVLMVIGSALVIRRARTRSSFEAAIPRARRDDNTWKLEPELTLPPPRRVELTLTSRLCVWLWLTAVVAALLYTKGYPHHVNSNEMAFSRFGVKATAIVHNKRHHKNTRGQLRYYLHYNFSNQHGEQVRASISVAERIYASFNEGDVIQIVYLPDNPLSHWVLGVESNGPRREGLLALLALSAVLAVLELQRRRHKRLVTKGSAISGTVLEVTRIGITSRYTVRTETAGVERKLRHSERSCKLRSGDYVTVLYCPNRPSDILLYRAAAYRVLR